MPPSAGALAGRQTNLPVERIHVDTQQDLAAKCRSPRPFVAIPAIDLLDGSGNVVALPQGELTQAQVSAALEKPQQRCGWPLPRRALTALATTPGE